MIYPMSCQVAPGSFDLWARQKQQPVLLAPVSLSQVQLSLGYTYIAATAWCPGSGGTHIGLGPPSQTAHTFGWRRTCLKCIKTKCS